MSVKIIFVLSGLMNIIKNKFIWTAVLFSLLLIHNSQAASVTNSTENLALKIEDVSLNFLTLTLSAHNFLTLEKKPVPRQVINVENVKISLELARSIFLLRFHLDCFYIENIFVSILKDNDENIFLFNKSIKQKEIDKLFGTETNKQSKAKSETSIDLSIPKMEIKNLNITCRDHNERTFLWSINNLNLYIRNFLFPPDKNKDLWSLFLSANLNNKTNSSILFSAKCRTVPDDSFLKLNITANNIDWKTLDMIVDTGKKTGESSKVKKINGAINKQSNEEDSSPFNAVFNSFSNEIGRISAAFSDKISSAKLNPNTTNFFNNTNISYLVFNFNWNMTVSNHIFQTGNINLKLYAGNTNIPPLLFKYKITNSPELLYGVME